MDGKELPEEYRKDFPSLIRQRNGKPAVYLDNACTTLVPQPVIDAMDEYYTNFSSCSGGRSRHWFAEEVTARIEGNQEKGIKGSREVVAEFINAASKEEIIFTQNASHALNILALGFKFKPGDTVLLTDKEHNSNLIPWLKLQKTGLIRVEFTKPKSNDEFDLDAFEQTLKNSKVRVVSMAYTSNSTGYTIPAKEIVRLAHRYGAKVMLDAAQTAPHKTIDVRDLDTDFLAFSVHKMCGPRGVGVLYGKKELLGQNPHEEDDSPEMIQPAIMGGGTVGDTTYHSYDLVGPPERFEVGIQNYPGQIGAGAAVKYLQQVGMDRITAHETHLNKFLTGELLNKFGDTGWFHVIGPQDAERRAGILTFEVRRPNAVGISEQLSEKSNIMIRDGVFCAHSYFNERFGAGWTRPRSHAEHRMVYRVSFYFYNTIEECRVFSETLEEIFKERSYI